MLQRLGVPLLLLLSIVFALQLAPGRVIGSEVCPYITVSGSQSGASGAQFVADVSGADANPTYSWSVSQGVIEQGQGTAVISVVDVGGVGDNVTATVDLGGLAPECSRSGSFTVSIDVPAAQ